RNPSYGYIPSVAFNLYRLHAARDIDDQLGGAPVPRSIFDRDIGSVSAQAGADLSGIELAARLFFRRCVYSAMKDVCNPLVVSADNANRGARLTLDSQVLGKWNVAAAVLRPAAAVVGDTALLRQDRASQEHDYHCRPSRF